MDDDDRTDFERYLDDGTEMDRDLTADESLYVYLELK